MPFCQEIELAKVKTNGHKKKKKKTPENLTEK